jgi:hypothetical protein
VLLGCGLIGGGLSEPAAAQGVVRERETRITGPRGRSIDRQVEIERRPGGVERQVQIRRPGGTLYRDTVIQRGGPGPGLMGRGYLPRPWPIVERNVFVGPRVGPSWSFGLMAAPMFTIPFWPQPAPPPVAVVPPAVVPAPGVVAASPPRNPAQNAPLDPVALAAQRLQSHHAGSRREGAETLGRLGDPRAVPALVNTLKYDSSKDVKKAAALALGEIGGHDAEVVLERCIIYEKKDDVRDAAAVALRRLRDRRQAVAATPPPTAADNAAEGYAVPRLPETSPPPRSQSSPFRPAPRSEAPALDGPADEAIPSDVERTPPPPPTPVGPSR